MPTLRQELEKVKWVGPRGRLLTMPIPEWCRGKVPAWLVERLRAYAGRFDWGITFDDPWDILQMINHSVDWRNDWGTAILATGVEVLVSAAIPDGDGQRVVAHVAKWVLKCDMAMAISGADLYCHMLAPKGTWR